MTIAVGGNHLWHTPPRLGAAGTAATEPITCRHHHISFVPWEFHRIPTLPKHACRHAKQASQLPANRGSGWQPDVGAATASLCWPLSRRSS